jgi:oligosaccharide repeat unit polymerase
LIFAVLLAVLVVIADFVRSYRGSQEQFYGASRELNQFEGTAFLAPSVYLYLSSHPGVFNAYWKAGGEHPFPGSNTFAPIFRILARLELAEATPHFSKFYNMPVSSNTGTYLRELHADFGIAGILIAPYLIGLLCTMLWFRNQQRPTLPVTALLTHMYIIVAFSYLYQVTRVGEWTVSLIVSLVASRLIDSCCARTAAAKTWPRMNKRDER